MLRESGEVPQRHDRAKKKVSHVCTLQATYFLIQIISKALVRDNFRCIVTGKYDDASVDKNRELEEEVVKFRAPTCHTQCAHIFPQSTNMGISGSKEGDVKVRIHVPSISAIANFLASSSMLELCGLFSSVSVTKIFPIDCVVMVSTVSTTS